MATYKTVDLINRLSELINDGYEYVDITELDADEEFPSCLSFSAIEDSSSSVDFEEIDSVELPEDYDYYTTDSHKVKGTDTCLTISFTYQELAFLKFAVDDALEYAKECSKNPSISRDELSSIKSTSVHWRNLQAKFAKFNKHARIIQE